MRIEIVAFDGMDELDAVLPFEVLSNAALAGADWDVAMVGVREPGTVVGSHGLGVQVDGVLGDPEAIIVPGGGWANRAATGTFQQAREGYLPERLRALEPSCVWIASVCTGAMLLAAAGLTEGRPATTHHLAHQALRESGAEVITDARVVDDGDLLTCGGVTAGLDLALWIVERELGADLAANICSEMECERSGPIWRSELTLVEGLRTR